MTVQPLVKWISTYEDVFLNSLSLADQPLLFRKWVHQNTQGLMLAVYESKPTVIEASFPPVTIPLPGAPQKAAQYISSAWFSYISSILWSTPPPVPPFSAISGVAWDVGLVSGAKASLQAALVTEFTKRPMGPTGMKDKAKGMSFAFYNATMSIGVLVSGMSTSGPPVPLVVPDKIL